MPNPFEWIWVRWAVLRTKAFLALNLAFAVMAGSLLWVSGVKLETMVTTVAEKWYIVLVAWIISWFLITVYDSTTDKIKSMGKK